MGESGALPAPGAFSGENPLSQDTESGPPTLPAGLEAVRTDSGLEYLDIEIGNGKAARAGQTAHVHLRGWLTDGRLFDDTRVTGEPLELVLGTGHPIEAMDEGVTGMKVGGKRRLIVPADLAYGADGHGKLVPPYATLILDVELVTLG